MTIDRFSKFVRIALVLLFFAAVPAFMAQEAPAATDAVAIAAPAEVVATVARPDSFYYAIAISIGIGCISAGYAVGKIGAAVMGAAAEKPEVMGKAIAFVGLGEGIALFGFLVALFLYTKM
ncbi:MAG: ATP synthase subunit C [Lentisphaeria bacterium]|nr:ATP synthase subunit C [Lentisphaeria bacterium]